MKQLFKSDWSIITAKSDKVVDIDIEGIIGFDWWDDDKDIIKSKEAMKAELKVISSIKATHINVNINSPGGDVAHGFSIHDLLASHEAHITTKVNGLTASAATVIAQAGDVREMSDNALYLVHNASTWAFGNKNSLLSTVGSLEKVDDRMSNLYAKRSGKTKESFEALMDSDNGLGEWISAEEAKDAGLIDEVFEPMAIAAVAVEINHKKYGYPDYKNKFQNLNIPKMANENSETTDAKVESVLDKFKALLNIKKVEAKKEEPKTAITDEEIQAFADTTNAQIEAVTIAKDKEIADLTESKDKEIAALKAKLAKREVTATNIESKDDSINSKSEPEFSSLAGRQLSKIQRKLGVK